MIDLHLHTTASDGTCTPELLVERAWQAGIRTMSVTDHDTMAGIAPAAAAACGYGMTVIPGLEITAADGGRDVHVLAYFLSEQAPGLQELLATQRRKRTDPRILGESVCLREPDGRVRERRVRPQGRWLDHRWIDTAQHADICPRWFIK